MSQATYRITTVHRKWAQTRVIQSTRKLTYLHCCSKDQHSYSLNYTLPQLYNNEEKKKNNKKKQAQMYVGLYECVVKYPL